MKPQVNLFNITYEKKIPLSCIFELTRKCNLNCVHCYLDKSAGKEQLSTARVKNILRQLKKAGTLYLVFTGGEPFLRGDLLELCRYARGLKFDLRIFTNGVLLTDKIADDLSSLNLSGVELSLYGKRKVHDNITKVKGSFDKTLNAINILKKHRIPVTIKCPLIKINFSEYSWLITFAKKHKINLKIDPTIAPKNNGDKSILKYRLSISQLRQLYKDAYFNKLEKTGNTNPATWNPPSSDEGGMRSHSSLEGDRFKSRHSGTASAGGVATGLNKNSLLCSAGHNLCAIDHAGNVYPCLQFLVKTGNLMTKSFDKIWGIENKKLTKIRNTKITVKKCMSCILQTHCQRCPGLALLEDGDLYGPSKIACKIAKITKVTKNTL
ncbi:MAG: radical SAM protein [Elusimicrobia bacterium]|nr:radical SAM protein [Candidatus Liberimonas magnetica]